ncbi:BCS1 N terminal-domain-containing protein [Aspergillus carlsbadensis]|nr:BCS1 N terminal-domain-containing protein [Aspergillus carlsbadensis]
MSSASSNTGRLRLSNTTTSNPHHLRAADTASAAATALLETFIPGYSILARILLTYLQIDLSIYIPYLLVYTVLAATIRYFYARLHHWFWLYCTSTAEVRSDDEVYDYLMYWLTRQEFMGRTRRFVAGTRIYGPLGRRNGHGGEAEDDGRDLLWDMMNSFSKYRTKDTTQNKLKPINSTPSDGTHYFWFRNRPFAFTRHKESNYNGAEFSGGFRSSERLYLTCIGRNPEILKTLLLEAQRSYVAKDASNTIIYSMRGGHWMPSMSRPPRPLSTVILDVGQKQKLIVDIKEYLRPRTRRWYSNRGIPYRRGYLLHGPPGTGKTSLCLAVAGVLGLPLYVLNLSSRSLSEDSLTELFLSLPARCIVLVEDVDCAGMADKRSRAEDEFDDNDSEISPLLFQSRPVAPFLTHRRPGAGRFNQPGHHRANHNVSLSDVLNVIDGVAACEGRILVMTTNHPEKLDPALIRPGRVDMTIEFGYSTAKDIQDLFFAIYSTLEGDLGPETGTPSKDSPHAAANSNANADTKIQINMNLNLNGDRKAVDATVTSNPNSPAQGSCPVHDNHGPSSFSQNRVREWALEFAERLPAGEFTPAEIQGYLLLHKTDPVGAIDGVAEWVRETREKKAGPGAGISMVGGMMDVSPRETVNGIMTQRLKEVEQILVGGLPDKGLASGFGQGGAFGRGSP